MRSLYDQDFDDPRYTPAMLLADVQSLVQSRQREGLKLDYKLDLSDSWVKAAAAFANAYGGLVIFGVETKQDEPVAVVGVTTDAELKTKLASQIISCVQPVPEFSIGVAPLDSDPSKQVAVVLVREGWNTPYVYSKADAHRVYVRSEGRNAEADYLQLMRLVEKGRSGARRSEEINRQLFFWRDNFHARCTVAGSSPLLPSPNFYRFIVVPHQSLSRPLNLQTEKQFGAAFGQIFYEDTERARSISHAWERSPVFSSVGYLLKDLENCERRWGLGSGVPRPGISLDMPVGTFE